MEKGFLGFAVVGVDAVRFRLQKKNQKKSKNRALLIRKNMLCCCSQTALSLSRVGTQLFRCGQTAFLFMLSVLAFVFFPHSGGMDKANKASTPYRYIYLVFRTFLKSRQQDHAFPSPEKKKRRGGEGVLIKLHCKIYLPMRRGSA